MRPKFEIEPLGEARWGRIERRVLSEAEIAQLSPASLQSSRPRPLTPRWRGATALVLAGAAAAVVGGIAVRTFLVPRDDASAHSRVITDATGSHVRVGASELDIRPQSAVLVSGNDAQGVLVVVDRGEVECEVAPRGERPPFTVVAGDVRVVVIGTHFTVHRNGDSASVEVQHGIVEVSAPGTHVTLHPGERWPSLPPAPALDIDKAPVTPTAEAPEPTAPARADTATRPTVTATVAPSAPVASPRDRYEGAMKLEAREPDRAIALYREVARSGGAWGMNALFAQARLELGRGNSAEGRRLLDEYLARYPSGPNADDARRLLARAR